MVTSNLGSNQPNACGRELSGHLIRLPNSQWAVWKWICVRASGFASHLVLLLASPACGAAADQILALEERFEEVRKEALQTARRHLHETADEEKRRSLWRALRQLNKGRLPEVPDSDLELYRKQFANSCARLEDARNRFQHEFQCAVLRISEKIRDIACDSRFRQAVLMQNGSAFRRVSRSFMEGHGQLRRGFKERQNGELIANYLQRYCIKNDTIGFFGPVGWAKVVPEQSPLAVQPGPALVSSSCIYFENWCIEALAEKVALQHPYQAWMTPRLLPYFFVEGHNLYSPGGMCRALLPLHAQVLTRCTGDKTAREIAQEILALTPNGLTESQIYAILRIFESRKVIAWSLEIPICLHPDRKLRSGLERIEEDNLRQALIEQLSRLDMLRENVSRAVGDAQQLDRALEDLDTGFTELTGKSCSKSGGAMYASRTLIYQDCQRDLDVEIGPEIIASLSAPLSLLLTAVRWFTYHAALDYCEAFTGIYNELLQKNQCGTVDFLQFWTRVETMIFDPARRVLHGTISEFQSRWEKILRLSDKQEQVQYSVEQLKPLVEDFFAAPGAGWQLARYHSPDVMIAAPSVEAICSGNYQFVLGELHMAQNTLRFSFAVNQHPRPAELFDAIEKDLPMPRPLFVPPKCWPRTTNRTAIALHSSGDYFVEVSPDSVADAPRSQVIPMSTLMVENSSQGLIIRTRDGSLQFPILEALGEILSLTAVDRMKLLCPRRHTPRVIIDRLVVARESWSVPAPDMSFIHEKDEHSRYLEARRWMRRLNLPRFVFVKVPVEVKPFYVDFDSPIYVEILTKMVRRLVASDRAQEATVLTEMLPAPDQLWLTDSGGQTYTSELRMVARDLVECADPI